MQFSFELQEKSEIITDVSIKYVGLQIPPKGIIFGNFFETKYIIKLTNPVQLMKAIILAGGQGTRLAPLTTIISKQLLPVYDKPMIYYALSVVMLSKIRDILLICDPHSLPLFKTLLGDGSNFGVSISYVVQQAPNGIAEAFLLGEEFINGDDVCLILGDNLFFGVGVSELIDSTVKVNGAHLFAAKVAQPSDFGVAEFDVDNKIIGIEEKPEHPKSNYAITGLYLYDSTVVERAKSLEPSQRGELEITDLNNLYLQDQEISVTLMGRGITWMDTGTVTSLLDASQFISTVQSQQGQLIGCLEEIALNNNWISAKELLTHIENKPLNTYYEYVKLSLITKFGE